MSESVTVSTNFSPIQFESLGNLLNDLGQVNVDTCNIIDENINMATTSTPNRDPGVGCNAHFNNWIVILINTDNWYYLYGLIVGTVYCKTLYFRVPCIFVSFAFALLTPI